MTRYSVDVRNGRIGKLPCWWTVVRTRWVVVALVAYMWTLRSTYEETVLTRFQGE